MNRFCTTYSDLVKLTMQGHLKLLEFNRHIYLRFEYISWEDFSPENTNSSIPIKIS